MGRGSGVRATSASSIGISFVYKGQRCRERIALPPTPANIKYVKRLKATIEHEIATQTFEYAKHFPESHRARTVDASGITFEKFVLDYVDTLEGQLEEETLEEYRSDAKQVASSLGRDPDTGHELSYTAIKRPMVRRWIAQQRLSKKRIDNLLIPVRGAYEQAVDDDETGKLVNPVSGLKVRRVGKKRDDTVDPFEPKEVADLEVTECGAQWKFRAWSGLSNGEFLGLLWRDVSLDCKQVTIRRALREGREKGPKTENRIRVLELLEPAIEALASLPRGELDDSVFINPNTGRGWHADKTLWKAFRRACKAAKVRVRPPNQLRHTFATWALSAGENPKWIAQQMGHADVMMVFRVYGKWMPKIDPDAGSKMLSKVMKAAIPKAA